MTRLSMPRPRIDELKSILDEWKEKKTSEEQLIQYLDGIDAKPESKFIECVKVCMYIAITSDSKQIENLLNGELCATLNNEMMSAFEEKLVLGDVMMLMLSLKDDLQIDGVDTSMRILQVLKKIFEFVEA